MHPRRRPTLLLPLLLAVLLAPATALGAACSADAPDARSDGSPPSPEADPAPPNVVLVLADDVGWGDPRCYNPESKIPTPHLDRLAREGLRLTDAHSPSGVCTPTRYGLLTGRYAWRTELKRGVLWGSSPLLVDPDRKTVADLFLRAGHATACVGKWHLGLGDGQRTDYHRALRPGPLDLGFDEFFGIPASADMAPYVYVDGARVERHATDVIGEGVLRRHGGEGFWRPGPIAPGFAHEEILPRTAERALSFVRRCAEEERRFFLYFPLTAAHTPWVPTEPFVGRSGAGPYGDFVAQIDAVVGQLLALLDELGLAEDTLFVFTSDNGAHWTPEDIREWGHLANGPLRGQKADAWEGGHRVPFLVRWPGHVPAGAVRDALVGHVDFFATFAALLGTEVDDGAGEDSVDVSDVLFGEEPDAQPRSSLVHHSFDGTFALRDGDWKLIFGLGSGGFTQPARVAPRPGGPRGQLYHLAEDPGERANLFLERPDVVRRLEDALREIRRR